jgi:uncharacterized protein
MLQTSKYNHFIPYDDQFYIGYNFLYRTIIRIPNEAYASVEKFMALLHRDESAAPKESISAERLPEQWLDALKQARFIIEDNFDELSLIKFRYNRSLYADDCLYLVVLPTLWCNLMCPYCFEFKKKSFMTEEVEQALVMWVKQALVGKKSINVAWFGGEPLLAKDSIRRLSAALQDVADAEKARYTSTMTTNGYYLDRNFLSLLPELGIKQIQVTLDGDRDDHNKLRVKRNGQGSFDRIIDNVIAFADEKPECKLTLRVNCTDENYDRIPKLLERLPNKVRKAMPIFFRYVWPNEASGNREFATALHVKEPFKDLSKLYAIARELGWLTCNPHNNMTDGYCEVDYEGYYQISPEGDIFLCSHTYDNRDSIGSVLRVLDGRPVIRDDAVAQYLKWYSVNPFGDVECLSCSLLPICSGGCRLTRMKGSRSCIEEKSSLDLYVRSVVNERIRQQKHYGVQDLLSFKEQEVKI